MEYSDVDKGWAWLIVVSTFIMCALSIGLPWAAGGAYNVVFLKAFPDATAATVAWATSSTTAVSYLFAPVGSILVNRYGLRFPALIGGIITGTGFIISFFAPSVPFLVFSFGVLPGIGMGIGHIAGNSAIAHYFDKHLGLATGLATSGTGVGMFSFAPIITTLDHVFGWRGSLLIVGGITLNMCVCGFINRKCSRVQTKRGQKSFLDWSLFRNIGFCLLIANNVCVSFGISIVYVHLMAFAESCGFTDTQSAMLMSSLGIANLIAGFTVLPATKLACVNVYILFSTFFMLSGIMACLYPLLGHSYYALVILSVGFGFFTVAYCGLLTIVVIETVGVYKFANGYGYIVLVEGFGHMCGGPFAGFLLDLTGTYDASLYTGGGIIIIGGIIPLFSLCCSKHSPSTVIESGERTVEEKTPLPLNSENQVNGI